MTTTEPLATKQRVGRTLSRVAEHNAASVAEVADLVLACVRADGMVLTAGAGHSLAAVAETFYRAGGLACVRPLYHPELLPMHGAVSSTKAERRSGLAAEVLGPEQLGEQDVLVVFSTSGVNPYPVELAGPGPGSRPGRGRGDLGAGERRGAAPVGQHPGRRGDVVLDTLVPPGDSTYPPDAPVAAPISTVVNAFLWNLVLVRLIDQAKERGGTAVVAQFQRARRRRGQYRPAAPLHAPMPALG